MGVGDSSARVISDFETNINSEIVHMDLQLHIFRWKNLIVKEEEKLKKKLGKFPTRRILFNLNLKEDIETYLIVKLKQTLISYFGDAVYYLSENSQRVIKQLYDELEHISKKDKKAEISLVSHSLGSVIAYDLLTTKKFQRKIAIENFVTVGSPLALFMLRTTIKDDATIPISGKWLNIYDSRDLIASQLSPFFKQCKDIEVKVEGANALTVHQSYFKDAKVLNSIMRTVR